MDILVVDDEKEIADLIDLYLAAEDYRVHTFYDPQEALPSVEEIDYDLAIIDVMMPGIDGFELCRRIRENHVFPVIMLTARSSELDKITGLTLGADDYLTKPFNPLELVARVKAQLRRYTKYGANTEKPDDRAPAPQHRCEYRGLVIDNETHTATLDGRDLGLTPTEFSILWLLCQNHGKVLPSEKIFESVWGEKYLESTNTVSVHIRRIREKMDEPHRPRYIQTVWGVGYKVGE